MAIASNQRGPACVGLLPDRHGGHGRRRPRCDLGRAASRDTCIAPLRGAAVLLVSEDLDEILQLSDRIVVMSDGKLALQTEAAHADVGAIGRAMAGH